MRATQPELVVGLNRRPAYSILVQFPVVCFVGALCTDVAYARTKLNLWESFSVWLLAAGCVLAGLAGVVGLFIFLRDCRVRAAPFVWPYALTSRSRTASRPVRHRMSSPVSCGPTTMRTAGRSAWRSITAARCWSPTTLATPSGV